MPLQDECLRAHDANWVGLQVLTGQYADWDGPQVAVNLQSYRTLVFI